VDDDLTAGRGEDPGGTGVDEQIRLSGRLGSHLSFCFPKPT
jgi:hypothetical protein